MRRLIFVRRERRDVSSEDIEIAVNKVLTADAVAVATHQSVIYRFGTKIIKIEGNKTSPA